MGGLVAFLLVHASKMLLFTLKIPVLQWPQLFGPAMPCTWVTGPLELQPSLLSKAPHRRFKALLPASCPSLSKHIQIILNPSKSDIRRPRPSLRPGRRLGPPEVWNLALKRAVCFLGLQRDLNSLLLAFKPAVCEASNPLKPSKSSFGTPDPARRGTKATSTAFSWPSRQHQKLFTGVQACHLPGFKPSKTVQNLPKPFLDPAGQRTKATSTGFLGLQRDINSFLLAFKPAVCQASNPSKPSKTIQTLFGHPWPRRPKHEGHINIFFFAFKATSIACYWRSSLPFARLQTIQDILKPSKGFFGTPDPAGQRTKATSTAFSWPSKRHQ